MKQFECVIFDWAGTTVDYGCFAPVQAFVEVFKHYGIEPTMEEVREPMGMLKIDHIRTMLNMPRIKKCWTEKYGKEPTEENVKELFGIFEEKLLSILHMFADPKPGVPEVISRLRTKGYEPDCWFSPDSTEQKGRPYPYMIYRNMEKLGIMDVRKVIKVGDTVSDIKEGKNAGAFSVGVIVGSSELGLSQEEFEALSWQEQQEKCKKTAQRFLDAGADKVVYTLEELAEFLGA